MFLSFMDELRRAGVKASLHQHLTLLEALKADAIGLSAEEFYYLARATFVKDESEIDVGDPEDRLAGGEAPLQVDRTGASTEKVSSRRPNEQRVDLLPDRPKPALSRAQDHRP